MKIQQIINNIFRQNFKDSSVLGRTLFGLAVLLIGFDSLFEADNYASFAPQFIPFAEFFAILSGLIFIVVGFLILANLHISRSTGILITLMVLIVLAVYLPKGDINSMIESAGIIGAAFLVRALGQQDVPLESVKNKK